MSRKHRIGQSMRETAAGMGLLLMFVSFVWLVVMPRPDRPPVTKSTSFRGSFETVILDPGHGGQDSGAMCGSVQEKDLTLDVAQRVGRLLQAEGLATLMTRQDDTFIPLADRAKFTNRTRDCILISIHFNEGDRPVASGVETYYAEHQVVAPAPSLISWLPFLSPQNSSDASNLESQSLAGFIQEALVARTGAVDRGAKSRQFFVIANVNRPAVLVEGGFISNKEDIAKLGSPDYREQLAAAVTEGVLRYRDLLKQRQTTLAVTAPAGR